MFINHKGKKISPVKGPGRPTKWPVSTPQWGTLASCCWVGASARCLERPGLSFRVWIKERLINQKGDNQQEGDLVMPQTSLAGWTSRGLGGGGRKEKLCGSAGEAWTLGARSLMVKVSTPDLPEQLHPFELKLIITMFVFPRFQQ